jgi:hypothetical protein
MEGTAFDTIQGPVWPLNRGHLLSSLFYMRTGRSVGEISGSFGGENEDVFRDVPPCSTVEIDRRFVGLMMEAVRHRKRR